MLLTAVNIKRGFVSFFNPQLADVSTQTSLQLLNAFILLSLGVNISFFIAVIFNSAFLSVAASFEAFKVRFLSTHFFSTDQNENSSVLQLWFLMLHFPLLRWTFASVERVIDVSRALHRSSRLNSGSNGGIVALLPLALHYPLLCKITNSYILKPFSRTVIA